MNAAHETRPRSLHGVCARSLRLAVQSLGAGSGGQRAMRVMGGSVLAALLCAGVGVAAGSQGLAGRKTLSQYDQVGAEVNGTLDIALLQRYLTETHSNTFSFLLWDTDGHQYLDMVRFLEATKDLKVDGAPLEVWVTLSPPSETYTWQNESECAKCPKSHPHNYGSAEAGIFCCNTTTNGEDCFGNYCCVEPGSTNGCQGVKRCGNNPENKSACGSGDPRCEYQIVPSQTYVLI